MTLACWAIHYRHYAAVHALTHTHGAVGVVVVQKVCPSVCLAVSVQPNLTLVSIATTPPPPPPPPLHHPYSLRVTASLLPSPPPCRCHYRWRPSRRERGRRQDSDGRPPRSSPVVQERIVQYGYERVYVHTSPVSSSEHPMSQVDESDLKSMAWLSFGRRRLLVAWLSLRWAGLRWVGV